MRTETKGTLLMAISAIFFSIGGLFIKMIPWGPLAINGVRCLLAAAVFGLFLLCTGKKLVWNKTVLLGALGIAGTAVLYNLATKFTTAANAIMLEYTSPLFIILMMALIYKKRPQKADVCAALAVIFGLFWFLLDSLNGGHVLGNALGLCAAVCAAVIYILKLSPRADIASSVFLGLLLNGLIFTPFVTAETVFNAEIFFYLAILGFVQLGLAYIIFFLGLSRCQPIPAVLAGSIEPVLNPILVAIFYGEMISPLAFPGVVIVFLTIVGYNLYLTKKKDGTEQAL